MFNSFNGALFMFVASSAFLAVGPTRAQSSVPKSTARTAASSGATTVGEILVTAQKRTSTLQKVPASIVAISGLALERRGISDAADLTAAVVNLNYGTVLGNPSVAIRGVGLPIITGDSQQGVASYLDGVYLTIPSLADLALGDLDRIEVLRGPQGTLYGRNATGGAINYITRGPSATPGGSLTVGYSNYNTFEAKGFITGPIIGDVLTGRLFASTRTTDGYITNIANGQKLGVLDSNEFRGVLEYKPNSTFKADLTGFYQRDYGSYITLQTFGDFGNPANVYFIPQPGSFSTNPNIVDLGVGESDHRTTKGGILALTDDVSIFKLKSITGYIDHSRSNNSDGGGVYEPIIAFLPPPNNKLLIYNELQELNRTFSQEFDVNGKTGPLDFVLGAYYSHETDNTVIPIKYIATGPTATFPFVIEQFSRDKTEQTEAAFVDMTYSVTGRLRFLAGARYSHDSDSGILINPIPSPDGDSCAAPTPFSISENHFSPRVGAQYDVAPKQDVYAQFSEGYKSGGNSIVSCGNFYKPESLKSYEVGYKAAYLSGRVTLNLAAFYYDYTNYQVFVITPSMAADIINAPKARTYGAEAEFAAQVTPMLRVEAGLAYLDASYSQDFFSTDNYRYGPAATPENLDGRPLVQAPKYTANGAVELWVPVNAIGLDRVTFRAEMNYSAKYSLRRFDAPFDYQGGYVIGNLFATLTPPGNGWAFRVYMKNVGDERYREGEIDNQSTGLLNGNYNPPRTFGADLTVNF